MKFWSLMLLQSGFSQQFFISKACISCTRPTPVNLQEGCEWVVHSMQCAIEGIQNVLASKVKKYGNGNEESCKVRFVC